MPHIINVTNPGEFSQPGKYIAETVNTGEFLAQGWCDEVHTMSEGLIIPFDPAKDWNDKEILVERPGGYGDILFLTPALHQIKTQWPCANITVACLPRFNAILHNNPDVATLQPYPLPAYLWSTYDAHIWLENYIENNPLAHSMHPIDILSERLSLVIADKRMRYHATLEEQAVAREVFQRTTKKRVGVQLQASSICRSYPDIAGICAALHFAGYEVFMFGAEGSLKMHESWENKPDLVNLTARGLSFRQSCAVLTTCDALVAPDSALCHVAGALDIPCVALFAPFPWQLRTKYAPKTKALTGHCDISPCFHHSRPATGDFPAGQPCAEVGRCIALEMIPIERIVREVGKML